MQRIATVIGVSVVDRRYATRVTLLYALAAGAWITFSDTLLSRLGLSADQISRLSLYKGLGFVTVTSIVLYASVTRGTRRFASLSERLSTFIDVAPIPIVSLDLQNRVVLWNPAAERVFGWTAEEVLGKRNPIVPEEEWDTFIENQERLLNAPTATGFEVVRTRKDGQRLRLRIFNAAVHDERGAVIGTIGVLEDITAYTAAVVEIEQYRDHLEELVKDRTARLQQANDELKRATEAKDTFVASMSHELRTPLNSIIGFTQILLQGLAGPMNAEQVKQMEMVNASGRHLLALINDILDLSKIEAGQTILQPEEVRISEVLASVEGIVRPLLEAKGLEWACECAETATLYTDKRRLEQILLNLLSNAVKFTDAGGVRLSANVVGPYARFEVADTGVGINSDALHDVFGEFVQLDTKDAIRPEGTGLGLAISRRLAHLLGGTLVAASEVGIGSTFVLTLPVGVEAEPAEEHAGSRRRSVLVVDDDAHARGIVTRILRDAGYVVRQAPDGASAMRSVADERPDVILLDLVLPGIDGWEIARRLKTAEETADIPLVCVSILLESEHGLTDDFAGYLVKPIDSAEMLALLDTVLAGNGYTPSAD
ncbi:MAG: hypothetical protein CVT59_01735 [Actinobacteria bacterium HGW-Actinobacteria-1]|nr:MAG: hypothetical protein CVT59_01735 [Actinobacteria bacterium HGW-Actinobacteria-1]